MYDTNRYFDEMNILRADKVRRINTAEKFMDAIYDFLLVQLADILHGTFLFDSGKHAEDYEQGLVNIYLSMAGRYDKKNVLDRKMILKAENFARYVETATERAVDSAVVSSEAFAESRRFGTPVKKSDVPDNVLNMLSIDRANLISLNETNWIYNYLNHMELRKIQETHTWCSMKDERVRDSHLLADGQTVPIDQPFLINKYEMMFPMDDSFGAPLSEILGCRCVEI